MEKTSLYLLSPTLLSLFVDDLLKDYELRVRCDGFSLPALATDDIVLLVSNPRNLQKLIYSLMLKRQKQCTKDVNSICWITA